MLHPKGSDTVVKVSQVHSHYDLDQAVREIKLKHALKHPGIIKSTSTVVRLEQIPIARWRLLWIGQRRCSAFFMYLQLSELMMQP